jgi:hypothetical protein
LLKGDEPGSSGGGSKKRTVMGVDYDYFHDELVIEDDVEGDKKVDRNGKLLGGTSLCLFCLLYALQELCEC